MRKILFIVALLISFSSYAERILKDDDHASIEGHVFDARTQEPIAYASIGIKGTSIGTVTDTETL